MLFPLLQDLAPNKHTSAIATMQSSKKWKKKKRVTCGRQPLKVNQSSGFQMEERFEHSLLTPSIPSGLRRSWEDPEGKSGKSMVFQWWYCMSYQYLASGRTDLMLEPSVKSHENFFYHPSYNLMSLLKWHQNNNQASTYHFQVFRRRGSDRDLFFPAGVLMFSSWWWWQEQTPLFTDVEHAGLVRASCVVFFLSFFPFDNISGMHLNHVAVLFSHYEPLW